MQANHTTHKSARPGVSIHVRHKKTFLVCILLLLQSGCSFHKSELGIRPDQLQITFTNFDPFDAYVSYRTFAVQLTDAYDRRASFNRFIIYGSATSVLGLATASTGLAAFGSAGTNAAKAIPLAMSFISGMLGIVDNR